MSVPVESARCGNSETSPQNRRLSRMSSPGERVSHVFGVPSPSDHDVVPAASQRRGVEYEYVYERGRS